MANILVVDDEPSMRLCVRDVLEAGGHTVTEAECVEDALTHLHPEIASMIDVAVIDGKLPMRPLGHTYAWGPPLCALARHYGIQTILMSAMTDMVEAERGLFFLALIKPFRMQELVAAVGKALDRVAVGVEG